MLVMRGLDVVHGSLYDMLNMSYTTMGGKQLCRIALGDADMLTEVHETFRCVVLQDKSQLEKLDAAFLNRFEKHCAARQHSGAALSRPAWAVAPLGRPWLLCAWLLTLFLNRDSCQPCSGRH